MRLLPFLLIPLLVGMLTGGSLYAQFCEESTATNYIQANRLKAAIRNAGDLFTDGQNAQFTTPLGNSTTQEGTAIYSAGLWLGGYNTGGNLHAAAQTYRQAGNDFWAGPIDAATGDVDSLTCARFDQVWHVSLVDVMALLEDYYADGVVNQPIPPALLAWPGRGNPHYPSLFGFALPNQDLAPFFDRNSDGIYNPASGDYPVFEHGNPNAMANELAWCVFNDKAAPHTVTDIRYMGIEVQLTAYAFNCAQGADVLKDVIFTRHRIINRSNNDYIGFRAGLHVDFDLGCSDDDYVGTDASLNTIYAYNADYTDGYTGCGQTAYGANPPVVSVTFLNQQLRKSIYNLASTLSPLGHPRDPNPAFDYYNLLGGNWVAGHPLTYGGTGWDTMSVNVTDFVFPNYPSDTAANKWWADDGYAWAQGQDFRMIGSIWGDTFYIGETRDIDMAYAYHYDGAITGLHNMLQLIPQRVPLIQQQYDNGFSQPTCYSTSDFDAQIEGQVYWDVNENCAFSTGDQPMRYVVIQATRVTDEATFYATSDTSGNYSFNALPYGEYELIAITPSPYWADVCVPGGLHTVVLAHPNQIETIDFPLRDAIQCAFLEVDVSTPVLNHCAENVYTLNYCNNGTDTAYNAFVEVTLSNELRFDSSSIAGVFLGAGKYQFSVGNIAPGACNSFEVYAWLSCDSAIVGQTHCVTAYILPDSFCISLWNGPIFEIAAECMGDSIQYRIANTGLTLAIPIRVSVIVIEDMIMRPVMEIDIVGTVTSTVTIPISQGTTYRANLTQPTGVPSLVADPIATAVVEGCGVDSLGQIHLGFVNMFSNGDTRPFYAVDCQESVDSAYLYQLKTNVFVEKQAFPVGYSPLHYIFDHTPIDYHIRVQNLNLNRVVIRDTISPYLDIASFEPGAASHPYRWRIYDEGIVEFVFDDLRNSNQISNDIYIKYRFEQKPFNPVGTIIESAARIELDTASVLITERVFHEIGEDFITILNLETSVTAQQEGIRIDVFPNPFQESAIFKITSDNRTFEQIDLQLFDALGRVVKQQIVQGDTQLQLSRGGLQGGIYFYRILGDGVLLQSGKVMVR